jgi:hypothetical protein
VFHRTYYSNELEVDTERGPLRHVAHLLLPGDVEAILRRRPTAHAILAIGRRAGRDRITALFSDVLRNGGADELCALLPFLEPRQREQAVEELLSSSRLQESVEVLRLVLLGLWTEATVAQLEAMQAALVPALTPPEVLRITRVLWNRPQLATLIAAIHRHVPLPLPLLRQVLDMLLDPARPVARREALQDVAVAASLLRRGSEDTATVLSTIQKVAVVFP